MAQSAKRTIGFCALISMEISRRWIDGILRYLEENPTLALRDYGFVDGFGMDSLAAPPPWKGKADAMILGFGLGEGDTPDQAMQWIERGGAPAVSLVWEWRHERLPMVTTDRDAVMVDAAAYLRDLGVNHMALVYDAQDLIDTAGIQRDSSAFLRRAAELGEDASECVLAVRPDGSVADFEKIRHEEELLRLLQDSPKPLGIFCITDLHARAVCSLCEELGYAIPKDVAILGCGDLSIARRHSPTISSVRTSPEAVGYEAAKLLHELLEGGSLPSVPLLFGPDEIVERESTGISDGADDDFRRAFAFIHRNACEGITVAEVVRHFAISRRRLELLFRERRGRSPRQEIQEVRLTKAKRLLRDTSLSIMRVAELTGFNDHARFTTFFREKTGATPTAYRQQS